MLNTYRNNEQKKYLTLSDPLFNQWAKFLPDFISNMSDVYSTYFH